MDSSRGAFGGSGNEQNAHNSRKDKRSYRHHSSLISKLESAFKECAHPNESQRRKLGAKLGLDPKQIKFWFQNKRTHTKARSERTDSTNLRLENESLQAENFVMRETLKNVPCISCGGPCLGEEERQLCLQNLKLENAQLKQEHERLSKFLARYTETNQSLLNQEIQTPTLPSLYDLSQGSLLNPEIQIPAFDQPIPLFDQDIPTLDLDISDLDISDLDISTLIPALDQDTPAFNLDFDHSVVGISHIDMLPHPMSTTTDMEKAQMADTATIAMEELVRLLQMNEPFWFRSIVDGKFILQRESYEKIFRKGNRLKGPHARFESSKDSRIVSMSGTQLVDMFLDADKWVDLFPTIVKKAQTIQVLESGLSGSRSGALQFMYAEMHILSPLVPTRQFYFLRYCKQVEIGVWVIADVSFDSSKYNASTLSETWRLPSGCMIQEMTNESCMVTWVEHVEVDDKIQTHRLFRELICGNDAYGGERWLSTLERMCERFACASVEDIPSCDAGGVINLPEGRRSVMQLAHRMVKIFCGNLDMLGTLDFPHLTRMNNSEVRLSVRNNTKQGVPNGMIVSASTSFWLPLSPQIVFDFLKDHRRRVQWDVLCYGNRAHKIQHISNGTHPDNCTSIIRPFIPNEENVLILQESCIDPFGAVLVYAPIDVSTINVAMRGEESSMLPILPSGFTISGDGRSNIVTGQSSDGYADKSGGSLLTLAIQVLACSPSAIGQLNMENVVAINALVASTVQKIKVALNCPDLD